MILFIILSGFFIRFFSFMFIENLYYIAENEVEHGTDEYNSRINTGFIFSILPSILGSFQIFLLMKIAFRNGRKLHSKMMVSNLYGDLTGYHD